MKKLTLKIEELNVDSFDTEATSRRDRRGTIQGRDSIPQTAMTCPVSCWGTCAPSCGGSCEQATCYHSCGASCDATCFSCGDTCSCATYCYC